VFISADSASMPDERPVTFQSNGKRMFALMHVPEGARRPVAVLFLNAGTHNRVGPHRIYVKTARRLCKMGFLCLRIDLPGVGDSEGDLRSIYFDMHDHADADGAVDFLTREQGVRRVAVIGICGGARCGVRLASSEPRVEGIALWGLPIVTTPPNLPAPPASDGDSAAAVSETAARQLAAHWLSRGLSPRAWREYLRSGRSVGQALRNALLLGGRFLKRRMGRRSGSELSFFSAIGSLLDSGRPTLVAYGESDAIPIQEFEEHFPSVAQGRHPGSAYRVIEDGDHTFTTRASEAAVIQHTLDWFDRTWPSDGEGSLSAGRRASRR
jgi:pimeloyl-ACP methyl ester carboxylesterase